MAEARPGAGVRPLPTRVLWLAPLLFGALAVALGQDANWDLRNYHWYNAWAFVDGRLGQDLAPAGVQSYLNPLLDLPYFGLNALLPPRAVAFVMGSAHGIAFVLLVLIARRLLPAAAPRSVAPLLAATGCLGVTFFAGLGNTMGDNLTALGNLLALLLALAAIDPGLHTANLQRRRVVLAASAGLVIGLTVGLKLSNGPFAVGLAVALMLAEWRQRRSLRATAAFALATLAGTAISAGYWSFTLWQQFGNPLFPFFNGVFQSDLAAPQNWSDPRWHPRGVGEALMFPLLFVLTPWRFHEVFTLPILWPLVYGLLLLWLALALVRRARDGRSSPPPPASGAATDVKPSLLLCFVAVSYAVWMLLFSVGRYLVTLELLLPLLAWLAAQRIHPAAWVRRLLIGYFALAIAASMLRPDPWGHAPFAVRAFSVEAPRVDAPERATVLLLDAPVAWMLPQFPASLSFIGLMEFPTSPGYFRRVDRLLADRGGAVHAIVRASSEVPTDHLASLNALLAQLQVGRDGAACRLLGALVTRVPKYRRAFPRPATGADAGCTFALPDVPAVDIAAETEMHVAEASAKLAPLGLRIDGAAACSQHSARIGARSYAYQFCRVVRPS